mmetsp:Transcript_17726/g.30704  ORF Transcript_17726/g.30704 Transcript_17726/m.30704 type:complete len:1103 (-) Transcript_17726:1149-4457(-)
MVVRRSRGHKFGHKGDKKLNRRDDLKGVQLCNMNLTDFRQHAAQFPESEFLYLRENEFHNFDPAMPLVHLKVLDLCQNHLVNVDFLHLLPHLRHLYLTGNRIESFEGFNDLEELETLCLSNNRIPSFEGLGTLPNLRILSVSNNLISDFKFFPFLPSLYVLNLAGNPLATNESYRKLAIAVCNHELFKIDNIEITDEELEDTHLFRGKIAFCITEGFVADERALSVPEQADMFLLTKQRETTKQHSLVLQHIHLESNLREGNPVTLQVCLQDRRPLAERKSTKFQSNQIYPVELTVSGEAKQVLVVGSMNNWQEPLELEKCYEDGNAFFHTTLYLPPGEYEYRYIVDGEEKVSEHAKTISKYNDTICNMYKVMGVAEELDPNSSTLLHIRWLRSNVNSGFDLIEGENSLVHVPNLDDVGACLRAEVLSYLNGQFEALVFDITPPIMCGVPMCTRLELQGDAVEAGELVVQYAYSGGQEDGSTFQWTRISPTGEEHLLQVDGPAYQVSAADIGSKLKVVYTPRRDDGQAGDPQTVFSPQVAPAPPVAKSIDMVGSFVEGDPISLETEYYGGREGNSRYVWYRQVNGGYHRLPGGTGRTYVPTADDVGQILTAEYTPVCIDGREGAAVRTDSSPITASNPRAVLKLVGDFQVGSVISAEAQYIGGEAGTPIVQWYRVSDDGDVEQFNPPQLLSYRIAPSDEGYSIGVQYTPMRIDGLQGEIVEAQTPGPIAGYSPVVKSLVIRPDALQEGGTAGVVAEYSGGQEGESLIEWFISDEEGDNYTAIPVETKNTRFIVLSGNMAYKRLKVSFTPVRKDGMKGSSVAALSTFIKAGPPMAKDVELLAEGNSYQGVFKYSGGHPGSHQHRWIRVSPEGAETTISQTIGGKGLHIPTKDDNGCRLKYAVKPVRHDGTAGDWVFSGLSAVIRQFDDEYSSGRSSNPPAVAPSTPPPAAPQPSSIPAASTQGFGVPAAAAQGFSAPAAAASSGFSTPSQASGFSTPAAPSPGFSTAAAASGFSTPAASGFSTPSVPSPGFGNPAASSGFAVPGAAAQGATPNSVPQNTYGAWGMAGAAAAAQGQPAAQAAPASSGWGVPAAASAGVGAWGAR